LAPIYLFIVLWKKIKFLAKDRKIVTITSIVEVVGTRTIEGMLEEVLNEWKHLKGFTLKIYSYKKPTYIKIWIFCRKLKDKLKFCNIRDNH